MATIYLIIFIFIIPIIWIIFRKPSKKTKLPPGPIGLPLIGHLHLLGKNPHRSLHRLSQNHGPIMSLRLGLVPTVVISSPAAAELVLKTHDLAFAGRPATTAAKIVCYGQRNLTNAPYGPHWRTLRKLCALHLLAASKIRFFRPARRAHLGRLVDRLRLASENRGTVDVSGAVSDVSGDVTCLMLFGRTYDRDFKAVVDEAMGLAGAAHLADFFPFVVGPAMLMFDPQGLTWRLKEIGRTFDEFLERVIDDRVRDDEKERDRDFVDAMMGVVESGEAGVEFDRRHVKAVLVDMLMAGIDTSATTIEWALSELIRHPECMTKLQKELERVVGMDQRVEESHLDELEYLDLVVKETFRLHPVIPLLIHESIEDCSLDGYHVAKGSRILVNLMSIGRDSNAWNSDVERFVPERFVGSDVDLRGQNFQLLPFGSGRRGCPGMQLGLTVVRLVLAQLVHCFDWELPVGMLPSELDMDEHFGLVMCRLNHLKAVPTYRLLK